jgi:diguanylate cyclase (GGDEF)-like protein
MDCYATLFQNCGDAVVIANGHTQIIYANAAAHKLFQDELSILIETNGANLEVFEVDAASATYEVSWPLKQVLAGMNFCDHEFLLRSSSSHQETWLSITGYPIALLEQPLDGGVLIIRDVTQQKSCMVTSSYFRDKLTGLVNCNVFMDRIDHALTRAQQQGSALIAILYIDIKRLKAVNDSFGYIAGDQLLVAVSNRLQTVLRPTDTLSRLGGDEFTILVEDVMSFSEVAAIADIIYDTLQTPFPIQGRDVNVDISLGISLSSTLSQTAETLLKQADIAMNRAKGLFGEKYCVFQDSMQVNEDNSLHLEMDLRKAITNNELFLEYQPIFLVRNQEIIGVESLVRWHHPKQGLLSPAKFIPLAEKTGLIIPLGRWVLEESCRQLKFWQEHIPQAKNLFVSVNMSSQQFTQKNLADQIKAILDAAGLSPKYLKIEITEGVLIENSDSIVEILQTIRSLGIKLSIDDFGTGYSSLSYLHKFPFDTLKIDRSFLENADSDFEKLEILQAMVRLAWNLGLEVVAEGIETQKHFNQIKALRCESGQGFLFSKPLGAVAMEAMLQDQ